MSDAEVISTHLFSANIKSTELTTTKLKTEEERLQRMKSEILRERDQLEKEKEQVSLLNLNLFNCVR